MRKKIFFWLNNEMKTAILPKYVGDIKYNINLPMKSLGKVKDICEVFTAETKIIWFKKKKKSLFSNPSSVYTNSMSLNPPVSVLVQNYSPLSPQGSSYLTDILHLHISSSSFLLLLINSYCPQVQSWLF